MRQKWHETGRDLKIGDIVLIHDHTELKGKYRMGIVESVCESQDGRMRSCSVSYTIPNGKDKVSKYSGGRRIVVSRSVQRLTLLLPIEEQDCRIQVIVFEVKKVEEK